DSKTIVEAVERSGTRHPTTRLCQRSARHELRLYAEHYRIECFFNRLKHDRAVAMRYAKRARNLASLIYLAATMLWMK
ncbi:MAG TPA: transposase, partial [Nitrospira sp.]